MNRVQNPIAKFSDGSIKYPEKEERFQRSFSSYLPAATATTALSVQSLDRLTSFLFRVGGKRERGRYLTIKNSESVMINKDFYNSALQLVSPLISTHLPLPDFFNLTSQIRLKADTDQRWQSFNQGRPSARVNNKVF